MVGEVLAEQVEGGMGGGGRVGEGSTVAQRRQGHEKESGRRRRKTRKWRQDEEDLRPALYHNSAGGICWSSHIHT